nr:DUF397 domain-containing protein [Kitasatospora sp. MAP12-44]
MAGAQWRKSPLSQDNNDCVEITNLPDGGVAVRDSKNPHLVALRLTETEWAAFEGGIRERLI